MIRIFVTACLLLSTVAAHAGQVHVLAINGGGDKRDNFASHLSHLRQLVDYLGKAGIPKERITVLSSDGADSRPDLAVRDSDPEGSWLLDGTREGEILRDLNEYENSVLDGYDLRPATPAGIDRAIAELKARLRSGDTLLVYVTDHGEGGRRDPIDSKIVLWGPRAGLTARRLGKMLATLPKDVRVVQLMSQCFSGGFAYTGEARENPKKLSGNTCGYFSSTPDRPAYGCYAEVRGQKAVGHSFEFLGALSPHGRFTAAHDAILVADDTPDIPLKTSDVYYSELLAAKAGDEKREPAFVDGWLARAKAAGKDADLFALAAAIAARFGFPAPTTVDAVDKRIDETVRQLDHWQADIKTWTTAIADFNQANLRAFLDEHPAWLPRLKLPVLTTLDASARRQRLVALLTELVPFVEKDSRRVEIARHLVSSVDSLDGVAYRGETRLAALWRIRFLFARVAGRALVAESPSEGKIIRALEACEDLRLPTGGSTPPSPVSTRDNTFPDPTLDEKLAATLRPAWLGVTFMPVSVGRRKHLALPAGAALVTRISPKSPAANAGLRIGDVVFTLDHRPLEREGDMRPFIATRKPNQALALGIRRGDQSLSISAVPVPAP